MFSLIRAMNKRLSKRSWGWWFDPPSRSLWRHCNDYLSLSLIFASCTRVHNYASNVNTTHFSWIRTCCLTIAMMTSSNGDIFRVTGPFSRGIHRSPVNSPHKGQSPGASMFSLICTWTNSWVNHRDTGDLRRHRVNYDITIIAMVGQIIATSVAPFTNMV